MEYPDQEFFRGNFGGDQGIHRAGPHELPDVLLRREVRERPCAEVLHVAAPADRHDERIRTSYASNVQRYFILKLRKSKFNFILPNISLSLSPSLSVISYDIIPKTRILKNSEVISRSLIHASECM